MYRFEISVKRHTGRLQTFTHSLSSLVKMRAFYRILFKSLTFLLDIRKNLYILCYLHSINEIIERDTVAKKKSKE